MAMETAERALIAHIFKDLGVIFRILLYKFMDSIAFFPINLGLCFHYWDS